MRHIKSLLLIAAVTVAVSSCKTPKDITYFQDLTPGTTANVAPAKEITAQPGDRVSIVVHSKDPLLVEQFNLPVYNARIGGATTSSGRSTSGNSSVSSYVIDNFGDIEFPVLGTLHIGDLTRQQIQSMIKEDLIARNLVKDPTVIVEFLDHSFTILGAVSSPGRITFNRDRLNLIEAIGMAGDLQLSGERQNVKIIRMVDGKETAYEVDLCDANSVYNSPVFYLQQNDVIYVEPNDTQKRNTTPNGNNPLTPTFWMSLASFAMTIALIFIK